MTVIAAMRSLPSWLPPALLVGVAFLVRLLYLLGMQELVVFDAPHMDEKYHLELVRQILSPGGLPEEPYFRAPLYPHFFAAVYALVGESLFWTRFVQIVIGSFLPLVILGLGTRLFDRRVGWTAAWVSVFYPTFLYYDASLLITSLMTLLTTVLLWQLWRAEQHPKVSQFMVAGVLLGVAGVARPNILLFGPVLIVWAGVILRPQLGWKKTAVRYAVMGLAAVLIVAPVTVRNYAVSGEFIPIAWQGGFNFYLGNHTGANGWSAAAPGLDLSWRGGYEESIAIPQAELGRPLSKGEISDYWYDRAWAEIADNPGSFVGLLVRKARLLVNGYEIPNNQNIYIATEYVPWLKPLLFANGVYFPFGLIAPLALVGIGLSIRRWRHFLIGYLLLGAYSFTLLLFFVCARFRQPMLPLLLLFAVFGSFELVRYVRERRWVPFGIGVVAFGLLAVHSNIDMLGLRAERVAAEDQFMIGTAHLTQKEYLKAERAFERALANDSSLAQAWANLGLVKIRQRQLRPAEDYFERALALEPTALEHYLNLATIRLDLGQNAEAVELLERAVALKPFNDAVHVRLAEAYTRLPDMVRAKAAAERALALNPANGAARQLIGRIDRYLQEQAAPADRDQ